MIQNQRPTIAELSERIRKNAWNWSIVEFAKQRGLDPKGTTAKHEWAYFKAIAKALEGVPTGLLEVISADADGPDPVEDAASVLSQVSEWKCPVPSCGVLASVLKHGGSHSPTCPSRPCPPDPAIFQTRATGEPEFPMIFTAMPSGKLDPPAKVPQGASLFIFGNKFRVARDGVVLQEGSYTAAPGPMPYNPELPTCPRCRLVVPELLACGYCNDCA